MSAEIKKQQDILHRLVKLRETIRQKYDIVKHNKTLIAKTLGETFKPLVEPLDKLVRLSEEKQNNINSTTSMNKTANDMIEGKKTVDQKKKQIDDDGAVDKNDYEDELSYDTAVSDNEDINATIIENDPTLSQYLRLLNSAESSDHDKLYGVYLKNDKYSIGNSVISFENGKVFVRDHEYPISRGLLELLFKKKPNQNIITQDDLSHYRKILSLTNAHKKLFDENNDLRRHKSKKFESIIEPLFKSERNKSGRGILPRYKVARMNTFREYVYFDDPNEIIERLKLLVAERSAGNNNHANEIHLILEELREGRYIY